jgi:hypothetical protein
MRTSLLVAISVVLAAPFGQAPELAQQYAQRLGRGDRRTRPKRHSTSAFCPIVIDTPVQQDQDPTNAARMITFCLSENATNSQLIRARPSERDCEIRFLLRFARHCRFIGFQNRTGSAQSRGSEKNGPFAEKSAPRPIWPVGPGMKSPPIPGLCAGCARRTGAAGCSGGESVSQSPLKFSTFRDQNPPFELPPKAGVSPPIFHGIHRGSSKFQLITSKVQMGMSRFEHDSHAGRNRTAINSSTDVRAWEDSPRRYSQR